MNAVSHEELATVIADVEDPELPHVTIGDLGMVREVIPDEETHRARVVICPTYTACPATEQIVDDVTAAARAAGWTVDVEVALTPTWTTDWISERGRQRLLAAGIAPPPPANTFGGVGRQQMVRFMIACPRCGSRRTERVAQFGSTACKASYRCKACAEPFDYFKPY